MSDSAYAPPVSVHLITWGNDFKTGMKEAAELGYTACETFTHIALEYEDNIGEFKEILASNGFTLSALYGGGRFSDPTKRDEVVAYNERVARFLVANGADRIVFGPAGPRTEGGMTLDELKEAAKTINAAAQRCYDLGVLACVHPHLWTEIETRREIDVIMGETNPDTVFFAPDTAHLYRAGMDPVDVMSAYKDRIRYVHLKDVTPAEPDMSQFTAFTGTEQLPVFCELGLGPVDFDAVMAFLKSIDYQGWLTVEIDKSTSTPMNSLRICRDYMEQTLNIPIRGR